MFSFKKYLLTIYCQVEGYSCVTHVIVQCHCIRPIIRWLQGQELQGIQPREYTSVIIYWVSISGPLCITERWIGSVVDSNSEGGVTNSLDWYYQWTGNHGSNCVVNNRLIEQYYKNTVHVSIMY